MSDGILTPEMVETAAAKAINQGHKMSEKIVSPTEYENMRAKADARQLLDSRKADLQRMYAELKRTLKPMSKNELIRLVGACLIDNYVLKMELQKLKGEAQGEDNAKVSNVLATAE